MEDILKLLGPFPTPPVSLDVEVVERQDCGSYTREKIEYNVEPDERITAYLCVPKEFKERLPVVFCHHQHHREFDIGKSEVVGLMGDQDQAYASELADRGFVTFSPDAIAFEERNWSPGQGKAEDQELAMRLVQGKTLMAKVIHDVRIGIDYAISREEVDEGKVGFIGHSYGGRMALWMPAFDSRIKVSVSNCGCVPYRHSLTHEAGIQAEFCIPGIMKKHDIDDVIKASGDCALLISATTEDKWSRGAQELFDNIKTSLNDVELKLYEGGHDFTPEMREYAYKFLEERLGR
jgi:dienelactone hydrolase